VTVAAMAFVARQLYRSGGTNTVLVIGQFLVALQLVKLWEQRGNRDFGQVLVLSVLLMVAASINTASLLFGLLLVAYLFIALYCCLLFHLKIETDAAKAAMPLPEEKISEAALRQDQRHLARSMRRLTGIVSAVAIVMAVFVFIVFPRGAGQNVLANIQFSPSQTLTGFSDEVNLTDVTRIAQNDAVVAHVELFHNDQRADGVATLLLRGQTLDTYTSDHGHGQWTRSPRNTPPSTVTRDVPFPFRFVSRSTNERWRQKILLHPTGTRTLFALAGPVNITSRRDLRLYCDADGVMTTDEPLNSELEYEVVSTGQVDESDRGGPRMRDRPIDPQIGKYAARPDVSGSNAQGPLAAQRMQRMQQQSPIYRVTRQTFVQPDPDPLDEQIADAIENHLRGPQFSYTLDTTDAKDRPGQDPYLWFLTSPDGHRGHCEYFAGAMVLMCQSLGINARMVTGFKCDEFNATPGAGYYIVRQSHAHAWVEVLVKEGEGVRWKTYDPTSGRDDNRSSRQAGLWTSFKHFLDFIEYTYATNVIAYDNDNRENIMQAVESKMTAQVYKGLNGGWTFGDWSGFDQMFERLTGSLANLLTLLVALGALAAGGWSLWQRRQLRRRAMRMGIESLPPEERHRLARQLGFYDDLVRLLARHDITRPPHLTPMEFARSLLFLPSDLYETVRRLTGVFYRVRYGRADLTPAQQRRLGNVINRVEGALSGADGR
jgi:protein-glutamine gamma-glutamyltransferase